MRLAIQILQAPTCSTPSPNDLVPADYLDIIQGETAELRFQFMDEDTGLRWVPSTIATVQVDIPRFPDILPGQNNTRQVVDYTISRAAAAAFPSDDRSIWFMPLTSADTLNLISTNVMVTVTDGATVKIALAPMAIRVRRAGGQ